MTTSSRWGCVNRGCKGGGEKTCEEGQEESEKERDGMIVKEIVKRAEREEAVWAQREHPRPPSVELFLIKYT
jgi:hypothetical protein